MSRDRMLPVVILVGIAMLMFALAGWQIREQVPVQREGVVVDATVDDVTWSRGRRAHPVVQVTYAVDGAQYRETVRSPLFTLFAGVDEGDAVRVTVHPDRPWEPWLASTAWNWVQFAIGALFFGTIGVLLFVLAGVMAFAKRR